MNEFRNIEESGKLQGIGRLFEQLVHCMMCRTYAIGRFVNAWLQIALAKFAAVIVVIDPCKRERMQQDHGGQE